MQIKSPTATETLLVVSLFVAAAPSAFVKVIVIAVSAPFFRSVKVIEPVPL
jgi:hypothetical protein